MDLLVLKGKQKTNRLGTCPEKKIALTPKSPKNAKRFKHFCKKQNFGRQIFKNMLPTELEIDSLKAETLPLLALVVISVCRSTKGQQLLELILFGINCIKRQTKIIVLLPSPLTKTNRSGKGHQKKTAFVEQLPAS